MDDWSCKQKKSDACYAELNDCWKQPWSEALITECQAINDRCSKIWSDGF